MSGVSPECLCAFNVHVQSRLYNLLSAHTLMCLRGDTFFFSAALRRLASGSRRRIICHALPVVGNVCLAATVSPQLNPLRAVT